MQYYNRIRKGRRRGEKSGAAKQQNIPTKPKLLQIKQKQNIIFLEGLAMRGEWEGKWKMY